MSRVKIELSAVAGLFLLVGGSCLLPACSHSAPGAEGAGEEKAEAAPAKAAPAEAAPAEAEPPKPEARAATIKELSFTPEDLRAMDDGRLEFCLDCRRKSATYTYCQFDKSALEAAVGADNFAKTVNARVSMVPAGAENSVPADPSAPQPDGGFTHEKHDCSVEEVLSIDPAS